MGRKPRLIRSLLMVDGVLEKHNYNLAEKYRTMACEVRWDIGYPEGAELLVVAYGAASRAAKAAVREAKNKGMKADCSAPRHSGLFLMRQSGRPPKSPDRCWWWK